MGELPQDLTDLLADWRGGNREAGNQLIEAAYKHLHRLASHYLQQERADHTLNASALVNELYVRLFSSDILEWQDRTHFFAVAAQQLRRILVDHARAARADKRGGDRVRVSLTVAEGVVSPIDGDILEVDDALRQLEALDPRAAAGVEMRFFGGLNESEIAEALDISLATLHRDWKVARAWLVAQLSPFPTARR
jgi:RNA polymerase sigma factor (TIGR02999 family)